MMRSIALLVTLLVLASASSLHAQQAPSVDLTPDEWAWLAENTIRIGPAPNYPPMEFFDENGVYRGIVADYVAVFEQRLGVKFEVVQYPTWNDVVEAIQVGDIDVWMEAADTEERREYLLFTEPYLRLPVAILVRQEEFEQLTVEDLAGRRTAVVEGYATVDYLRERVPGIDIIEVPSVSVGLERLSFGSVDALVASTATAGFYSNELGISGLRVAGASGFEWLLAIGSSKDKPILHEILRKTLNSIDPAERRALYRGWVTIGDGTDPALPIPTWVIVLGALVAVAVLARVTRRRRGKATRVSLAGTASSWPIYLAAGLAAGTIIGLTWWAEGRIADRMREDVGDALQTVLNTTSQAVYQWFAERESETRVWAGRDEVEQACRLLLSDDNGTGLISTAQGLLDGQLAGHTVERGYLGFHLVAPSGEILGSTDTRRAERPRLTDGIESLRTTASNNSRRSAIGLPVLGDAEPASGAAQPAFMLVGALVGDDEKPNCLLVFEIDPELEFTRILQRGRIGDSGESYAFNAGGRMISDSRFVEDLRRIGLLADGQLAILGIEIRDPGNNMVTGFRPSVSRSEQPLTRMTAAAIGGRAGSDVSGYRDYRGVPVVGAWTWDETSRFGIATEIDVAEAFESLTWTRRLVAGGAALVIGLILTLTLTFRASENKRRRNIRALQTAHEELDSVGSVILRWDRDGNIVYLNEFGLNLFGFSEEELIGRPQVGTIVPDTEETRQSLKRFADEVVDNPDKYRGGEYENSTKSGKLVWMAWQNKPILHEDGSLKEILCIGIDITERKLMEEELEKARNRMEEELNVGREIQMSMLPLIFPPYPRRNEFDVYACLEAAREVGGDFYDFFLIDEGLFGFCVGDVSGKGVPAALFMAVTKTLVEARARTDPDPASILTHVNDEISRNNEASMFVTLFLGILDTKTGDIQYSNGGHNPPYVKRHDGELVRLGARHGPVIGAMDGMVYGSDCIRLEPRDRIFMYTDGVTEAMDPDQALYGEERLESLLLDERLTSLKELVDASVADVTVFEAGSEQTDDVTVLAVEFVGSDEGAAHDVLELQVCVPNRLEEIRRVIDEFAVFAEQHSIPDMERRAVNVALDELLSNTISYAFEDDADHFISVRVELSGDRLDLTLRDEGVPFNPFAKVAETDSTLSIEERPLGGVGIQLVQNMMDEASYHRRTQENVVSLTKYLEPEGQG